MTKKRVDAFRPTPLDIDLIKKSYMPLQDVNSLCTPETEDSPPPAPRHPSGSQNNPESFDEK